MRGRRVGLARSGSSGSGTASRRSGRRWRSCRCRWRASAGCAARRRRWPPARARWRCAGNSASARCRRLSSKGTAAKRSRQAFCVGKDLGPTVRPAWDSARRAFRPGLHVDLVDAQAVGGIGEARLQLVGIVFRLPDAFGQRLVPRLGLDHRQLVVAIDQHIVGDLGFAAPARASMRPG